MELLALREPYKSGQTNIHTLGFVVAGCLSLCNQADIVQWHVPDFNMPSGPCVEQSVRASRYMPLIELAGVKESYHSRLESFLELEDGWDGYDAIPLEQKTFENVTELIERLPEDILGEWELFPSDNGSVMIVLKKRVMATVNVGNSTVSYVAKDAEGHMKYRGRENFDADGVAKLMRDIILALA